MPPDENKRRCLDTAEANQSSQFYGAHLPRRSNCRFCRGTLGEYCHRRRSARRGVWAHGSPAAPRSTSPLGARQAVWGLPERVPSLAIVPVSRFLGKMRSNCIMRCASTAVAHAARNPYFVGELCEAPSSLKISSRNTHRHWNDLLFPSSKGAIVHTVSHPVLPSRVQRPPNALPGRVRNFERQQQQQQVKPTCPDQSVGSRARSTWLHQTRLALRKRFV